MTEQVTTDHAELVKRLRAMGHERECDAQTSREAADEIERLRAKRDAVLVEYDEVGGLLLNERVVGHWDEGFKALRAALAEGKKP